MKKNDALKEGIRLGLLQGRSALLIALHNKKGIGFSVSELSEATGMSKSLVSMTKDQLLKDGQVEVLNQQRDGRKSKVYLTYLGRDAASDLCDALVCLSKTRKQAVTVS